MIKENVMDEFLMSLPEQDREIYNSIADYAISLGYKPKKAKTNALNIVFTSTKTKKYLLKMSIEKGVPVLKMKYHATKTYSRLFHEAVRLVIEEFNFKYTGCYGCGKCQGEPEGYTYTYPGGQSYFRCGGELIPLPWFTADDVPEIIYLLKAQHDYYLQRI